MCGGCRKGIKQPGPLIAQDKVNGLPYRYKSIMFGVAIKTTASFMGLRHLNHHPQWAVIHRGHAVQG